jgi:hypothetical protein
MTITDTTAAKTENDPDAALNRLEELVDQLGLADSDHLDELVYDTLHADASEQVNDHSVLPDLDILDAFDELHDAADDRTSLINDQGVRAQLAVLLDAHGETALIALLHDSVEQSTRP